MLSALLCGRRSDTFERYNGEEGTVSFLFLANYRLYDLLLSLLYDLVVILEHVLEHV